MNHSEFMHYIRNQTPSGRGFDVVPRTYKNAVGVDEVVWLNRSYWKYADWLQDTEEEVDIAEWVIHCDKNNVAGYTLSHQLMFWLWTDECNRFRQGLKTPNTYPPMGYEGWADEFHSNSE